MAEKHMKQGTVRIIAGQWRGRRLKVPDIKDLRPTPDRVRETLFNWLAPTLLGARCLDLFAGTGVLGFEALSRGAGSVVLVDQSPEVVAALQEAKTLLNADTADIYRARIPEGLRKPEQSFDIVFLDPPYNADLLLPTCRYLADQHFLASGALIYLEAREVIKDNDLPDDWQIIKSQRAGEVAFHLARVKG
jgi:16S rRNA (guanine966-N2)-methyltransferase